MKLNRIPTDIEVFLKKRKPAKKFYWFVRHTAEGMLCKWRGGYSDSPEKNATNIRLKDMQIVQR